MSSIHERSLCRILVSAVLALLPPLARGADEGPPLPHVLSCDPRDLAAVKRKLAAGDKDLAPAYQRLLRDADRALKQRPLSVLDKQKSLPGADRHDYVSYAPYFWPNPDKPGGVPYVRKDGHRNNELIRQGDASNFNSIKHAVGTLALAYYFTGEAKYAEHAATLLRVWFLDPKTHMNPNLDHSQAVPGSNSGRGSGVLEFRDLPQLADSLGLLEPSPAWTEADRKGMREWLQKYHSWLTTSKIGHAEEEATNNHGVWYDVQRTGLALYLRETEDARRVATRFGERRIAAQVQPDGGMPRELARADSWGYSVFNVSAMESMAELAERVDVDLWKYRTRDGRSLRAALDYLTPYLDEHKKWSHVNDKNHPAKPAELADVLIRAVRGFGAEPYQKLLDSLPRDDWEGLRDRLLHTRP